LDAGHDAKPPTDATKDAPVDSGVGCTIGGKKYVSGAVNPHNACETCQPATSTTSWTGTDGVNAACAAGEVCAGSPAVCTQGCWIGGAFASPGLDPSNPCQTCVAGQTAWTNVTGPSSCPSQEVCNGATSNPTCQAGCWINSTFYAEGSLASNGCEICTPSSSTTAWTNATDGTGCLTAEVCSDGTCVSGCYIDGALKAPGAVANDGCEVCTPATSTSSWTDAPDDQGCGNGQVCTGGMCGTQCIIGGVTYPSGSVNTTDPCESCQPGTSGTGWTSTVGPNSSCTNSVCNGSPASCEAGCWINNAFVSPGVNPSNPCQSCEPATSTTEWQNTFGVNSACGGGEVCAGSTVATCQAGCWINNQFYASNAIANGGCESCTSASTSGWTFASGGTSCGTGVVCSSGNCVSDCFIGGSLVTSGTTANDGCEVCTPGTSTTGYTNEPDGTTCGTGGTLTCIGGACGTQCDISGVGIVLSGVADGSNPCLTCQPGTDPTGWTSTDGPNPGCGTGEICSGGACASACYIGGAVYSQGENPADPCQTCVPGTSTTAWVNTNGLNSDCGSGEVCNGTTSATCQQGCWVGGQFYAPSQTANGGCETCEPTTSTAALVDSADGSSCGGGVEVCSSGSCVSGCYIDGALKAPGAVANDGCEVCTPTTSTTAWTNVTDGTSCGTGGTLSCIGGACGTQCDIPGTGIVASGVEETGNPCLSCQPGTDPTGWTSAEGPNSGCGTGEVCAGTPAATCQAGCWISNAFEASGASTNGGCEYCDPTVPTAWSTLADGSGCGGTGSGTICISANCVPECDIGGTPYTSGAQESGNACETCQPSVSTSGWTPLADGTSCGTGMYCSSGSCVAECDIGGTIYASGAVEPSFPCETCQPAVSEVGWSPLADGTGCGAGVICDTGACVAECDISGTGLVALGYVNPTNACQVCTPSTSTTQWSNATDGTTCGDGGTCSSGVCGGYYSPPDAGMIRRR
jgi:hypothetical protein